MLGGGKTTPTLSTYRKNKVWQKLLWGSGGDHPPRRRFGGRASKVFLLILTLILLPLKGGLGAQPQGLILFFCPKGIMFSTLQDLQI